MTARLVELAHAKHLQLGIRSANCALCERTAERRIPEWIRRAQERRLPPKVWSA